MDNKEVNFPEGDTETAVATGLEQLDVRDVLLLAAHQSRNLAEPQLRLLVDELALRLMGALSNGVAERTGREEQPYLARTTLTITHTAHNSMDLDAVTDSPDAVTLPNLVANIVRRDLETITKEAVRAYSTLTTGKQADVETRLVTPSDTPRLLGADGSLLKKD